MRSFPTIYREKPSFARPVRVKDPDPHNKVEFPSTESRGGHPQIILECRVLEVEAALR